MFRRSYPKIRVLRSQVQGDEWDKARIWHALSTALHALQDTLGPILLPYLILVTFLNERNSF